MVAHVWCLLSLALLSQVKQASSTSFHGLVTSHHFYVVFWRQIMSNSPPEFTGFGPGFLLLQIYSHDISPFHSSPIKFFFLFFRVVLFLLERLVERVKFSVWFYKPNTRYDFFAMSSQVVWSNRETSTRLASLERNTPSSPLNPLIARIYVSCCDQFLSVVLRQSWLFNLWMNKYFIETKYGRERVNLWGLWRLLHVDFTHCGRNGVVKCKCARAFFSLLVRLKTEALYCTVLHCTGRFQLRNMFHNISSDGV